VAGGHPWLAAALDLLMRPMYPARELVIPAARGSILEIGVGTGLNFDLYDPQEVSRLTGVEPDPHMLSRVEQRASKLPFPVDLRPVGAEHLPFPDASFDTVVATWVLCTIPEPAAAVAEMRRVLRPDGRLLFAEHTRSVQPALARVQTALTPLWRHLAGGCHLDRSCVDLVREGGFAVEAAVPFGREHWTLVPVYHGVARPLRDTRRT
jgi:SAM-dependent methyltransferase